MLLLFLALPLAAQTLPPNVEKVETYRGVTQYRLKSNDMTIVLVENHTSPVITFEVVYHVGSRNEAPGNTGSAHLLEHMIFNKSTENYGRAKGHKTFQEVLYEAGADFGSTNMTTWNDRMTGYSTLPADKLELAMKVEADRLGRGLILDSERQSEMSVVRNEYEIGENNPSNALGKAVVSAAITAHPYHWDTIGYRSDIEGVSTDKLREHYKNFFYPNNAEAVLVGDFDPSKALAVFDREFGGFKKSEKPIPQVITVEPPQEGERRVTVSRPGTLGIVLIGYMRPGGLHADFISLDVLSEVLADGVNARLYRALVDKGLATSVSADNYTLRDPYPLLIEATIAPGKTHDEVERAIKASLAELAQNGITDEELQRAQQQIEVSVTRQRDGTYPYASSMGESIASTNWKWFLDYVDNAKAVTKEDVKRVAATYLVPEHATVGWFLPAANAAKKPAETKAIAAPAPSRPAAAPVTGPTPSVAPTKSTFAARTTRKVLSNGIVVDVIENHSVPTVAVRGVILGGDAAAPADKPALPSLTARMLQRGTVSRTKEQIGALLEGAGATRGYFSNAYQIGVNANGMARDLPMLLDIVGDELKNAALTAEELGKAKAEMKTDVLRANDNTGARAVERLTQAVYPASHPYRQPGRDKMVASVEAASADDIRAWSKARLTGANTIIAIVGDVTAAQAVALVEKNLGSLPKGTRVAYDQPRVAGAAAPIREPITMRGKANMNIIMGEASGLRRTDPDYEAALVANAALGQNAMTSRIGQRVRDREGLSYSLASQWAFTDALDGLWYVNVNVAPQNLAKALASTRDEIEKFAREGITDEELDIQKNFFAGNFQVGMATNTGIAAALVTAEKFGYGPRYLDEYPSRIRAVTKEQANAAFKKHFAPERLNVIVAGDLEALP